MKQVKEAIKKHILECVTNEDGETFNSFKEAAERLKNEFERVADYPSNLKKLPNKQYRFSDYLLGIPFNFEYTYYGIKEFLNGLGINPEGKDYPDDKSLKLYHYLIFKQVF